MLRSVANQNRCITHFMANKEHVADGGCRSGTYDPFMTHSMPMHDCIGSLPQLILDQVESRPELSGCPELEVRSAGQI